MDVGRGRGAERIWLLLIVGAVAILVAGCGGSSSSSTTSSEAATPPHQQAHHVQRVRVPDLVGERFGQAVQKVKAAGLEQEAPHFTGTTGNPHYSGHCQKILNQSPPAGTRVPEGFTVAIVYGVCPKAISHPNTAMKKPVKRGE
jgi:hypothetical protein